MPAAVGEVSPKQVRVPVWQAGPGGLDHQQQRVVVAVGPGLDHPQRVARGLALLPEGLAAAAPEVREPGLGGARDRLGVGPREHQHVAAVAVLCDHGQQAARVEDEPLGHRDRHQRSPPAATAAAATSASAGGRTQTPRASSSAFASGMRISPKWKTDAASAALAGRW